jgi:hemolysin III
VRDLDEEPRLAETVTSMQESNEIAVDNLSYDAVTDVEDLAPLRPDQEWANALTHGIGAAVTLVIGTYLVFAAAEKSVALAIACAVYIAAALLTFTFSTLSHVVRQQPMLNTMRAWDQAMIYAMISGTYTPIVYRYATESVQVALLIAIWIAAGIGIVTKLALRHRINSIGSISYLLLGWLPSIPLVNHVSSELAWMMILGGVLYTIGVSVLINDHRLRYLHAVWHLCVMSAAICHYLGILYFVVEAP